MLHLAQHPVLDNDKEWLFRKKIKEKGCTRPSCVLLSPSQFVFSIFLTQVIPRQNENQRLAFTYGLHITGGFCAVVLLSKLLLLIVSAKKENLFAIQAAGPERGQLKSKVHHRMHWYQKWGDTRDVHCRCSGILLELGDNITHITAFTWDNTVTFQNHGAWEKYLISHGDGDFWEGQCSFPSGKVCLPSVQFSCWYIRQSSLQGAYY